MRLRPRLLALSVVAPLAACAVPTLDRGDAAGASRPVEPAPAAAALADPVPAAADRPTDEELLREADAVLDDWHAAAAVGERDRYLGHLAEDAVFLGTDARERWDRATFTAYVDRHFRPGRGWAYEPSGRHVMLGPDRRLAWFDELLDNGKYGRLRGTGVLRREDGAWRIAHYSMTFLVPNEVALDVVELLRSR